MRDIQLTINLVPYNPPTKQAPNQHTIVNNVSTEYLNTAWRHFLFLHASWLCVTSLRRSLTRPSSQHQKKNTHVILECLVTYWPCFILRSKYVNDCSCRCEPHHCKQEVATVTALGFLPLSHSRWPIKSSLFCFTKLLYTLQAKRRSTSHKGTVRNVYNIQGAVEIPRFDVNELGMTPTESIYGFSMILRINVLLLGAFAKLW